METEPRPLPPELREALAASGGLPVRFEDPDTHELYVLQASPCAPQLDADYLERELAKGLADFEAGRFEPWDVDALLAEAHRRHAERLPDP